jgi:acyl-CoA synthetase (AMP-forming)/AMP-acid ligase II
MVIGSLPASAARRYPDKAAAWFRGQTTTFEEFNHRVDRLIHALKLQGLAKGDKVSILSRNCPQMLEVMFAAARAGMVYVPLNFRLAAPEMKFVLNDAEVQILFVGDDFKEIIGQIADQISCSLVVSLGEDYESLLKQGQPNGQEEEVEGGDLFAIFYTSGTTGGPKGVMLTHDNFLSAAINHLIAYQFSPSDVCYHSQPFYHTMQASLAICCFYVGATSFIVDSFDPHEFWGAVRDHGVTMITLVYTMLVDTLDAFEQGGHEKGSLHSFTVGGQSVPVDVIQRTQRLMGEGMIFQVYGLTEAAPLLTYLPREEMVFQGQDAKRLASIGKELFSCQVRVVDEDDRDVEPGVFGEIIARGPNVMQGYWQRPQETAETLRGGWLRTGDVATIDQDGYLYIVDRKKDIIISGGENISSREVEEVLYQHSLVQECAVIGLPDARWGEQVRACVVLKSGAESGPDEIITHCRERLAKYKCPRSVVFLEELPKDPLGKIQKRILRDQYGAESS